MAEEDKQIEEQLEFVEWLEQLEFIAWLEAKGLYNELDSDHLMRRMHEVWKAASEEAEGKKMSAGQIHSLYLQMNKVNIETALRIVDEIQEEIDNEKEKA